MNGATANMSGRRSGGAQNKDFRPALLAAIPLICLLIQVLADQHRAAYTESRQAEPGWHESNLLITGDGWLQEQSLRVVFELGGIPVNTAGEELLTTIPGIGPVLAERIVSRRHLTGPYRKPADLMGVSGIGPRRAEQISPHLRFD